MARKQAVEDTKFDSFDMTPMIDIVFQLVVFLMIANDMSRKEIEEMTLPTAIHGTEDQGLKEKRRLIVNLLKDPGGGPPTLKVRGREMNLDTFEQYLQPEAEFSRETDGPKASELFILIRADKDSRWQDVQWVMQACANPKIRVYKLQFATTNPELQKR